MFFAAEKKGWLSAFLWMSCNCHFIRGPILLARARRARRNRRITLLGSDPQVFVIGKLHLDLAEFAIVIVVGRLVSDHVLAAEFTRDLREASFQFNHFGGEKRPSSSLFSLPLDVFVFPAINRSGLHAEESAGFRADDEHSGFGTLRDVNRFSQLAFAFSVFAVGQDDHRVAAAK